MWYAQENNIVIINVYVQPGAKQTEIIGLHGDSLKIRLISRPVDGKANNALLHYLAEIFDVPLRQVELKKGDKSRYKKIAITGSRIDPSMIFNTCT